MKNLFFVTVACLMLAASTYAESAHKGWGAGPAQWPGDKPQNAVVRDVGMTGPSAGFRQPDPPTNATFQGGYCFKRGSGVTVKKVYMMTVNQDGTISTREIKITPPNIHDREVTEGYSCASFSTEKVSFKAGDVFIVVFKADDQTIPVFLKVAYSPFVPS